MRTRVQYKLDKPESFKDRLLLWAQQYNEILFLDSNGHKDPYGRFDVMVGLEAHSRISASATGAFEALNRFICEKKDWLFGYLGYDLKNDVEALRSDGVDEVEFPDMYFFQPRKIIRQKGSIAEFLYLESGTAEIFRDYCEIISQEDSPASEVPGKAGIRLRTYKEEYYKNVDKILKHIRRGDIYELNYCQEFYARDTLIDPLQVFKNLNRIATPPFASFLRTGEHFALSSSPERFLQRQGRQIISQPIKGTIRRSSRPHEDNLLRKQLELDPKERAENIMIVDLVRNDLSRHALKGSVKVSELCGAYTFKQLHHMISTVEARVSEETNSVDILKNAYPMGSMTGAPKVSAMELIEEYELNKRGLYSGAMGYFDPNGDFDFSVVIRSILYNRHKKYLSFSVGSAITARSNPNKEYQECLLKAKAIRSVLENPTENPISSTNSKQNILP